MVIIIAEDKHCLGLFFTNLLSFCRKLNSSYRDDVVFNKNISNFQSFLTSKS